MSHNVSTSLCMSNIFTWINTHHACSIARQEQLLVTGHFPTILNKCPILLSLYHIHNTLHNRSKIINVQANFRSYFLLWYSTCLVHVPLYRYCISKIVLYRVQYMQFCNVLYCTVLQYLYCIILYCTVLYCILLYCVYYKIINSTMHFFCFYCTCRLLNSFGWLFLSEKQK